MLSRIWNKIWGTIKDNKIINKLHLIVLKNRYKEDLSELDSSKEMKRCILILTPSYGNLGDQAIYCAERKFLSQYCTDNRVISITDELYRKFSEEIVESITVKDVILIQGGGFVGSLYPEQQILVEEIIEKFPKNHIVILPQTFYFENNEYGNAVLEKTKILLKNHGNVDVFLRDKQSYDFVLKNNIGDEDRTFLVPDLVTVLDEIQEKCFGNRKNEILCCLRGDKEKTLDGNKLQSILNECTNRGIDVVYTDTVLNKKLYGLVEIQHALMQKWKEFASAQLIITDRLHGMLFAAITGTPCIAFDNCSKKVSGAFEWISHLEYVVMVRDMTNVEEVIYKVLSDNTKYQYDNSCFKAYYKTIQNVINRDI